MQKGLAEKSARGLAARGFDNAYLLLILTMLIWAGNTVVARGSTDVVPPLTLAWARWTIAACLVWPFAWRYIREDLPEIRAHWPVLLMLGTIGAGAFNSLYYIGLSKTTALNGLIINSAVPILIPIAVFVMYREMLSRLQAVGIALSFIGVLIVLTRGNPGLLATLELNEGDLWVLAAMTVWAIYTSLLRKQPNVHWLSFATICFTVASVVNFPLFLGEMVAGKEVEMSVHAVLAIGYVAIFPSIGAQIFYIRGVLLIGGSRAGVFMHLVPLFGGVLAILFLGESLYLYHLGGFALILSGVWLASRPVPATSISS